LHKAIESNPRFSSSAYNLALFYQRLSFFNDAEHWYLHAIAHNPHHVLSYNNLGVLYMNIGRRSLALHYFKAGLVVDPDNQLIHSNIPSVHGARVLSASDVERVFQEPSVCNVALVCLSVQRASTWGKPLTAPLARASMHPQPSHPLASVGNGPVNFANTFSDKVSLVSAVDDADIPEHATPVQLRPDDYLQLLERALKDQPNNAHFRKLAIETCDSLGHTECGQRHRSMLNSVHSHRNKRASARGKTNGQKS
jgi:tetratricopeptide (TPR) repeat protein